MPTRPATVGVDLRALAGRCTDALCTVHPSAEVHDVRELDGGASSLTYAVRLRGVPDTMRTLVAKISPPGLAPVRNRDVLRQARLLRALAREPGIPVPTVICELGGTDPPGFLMTFAPGSSYEPNFDGPQPGVGPAEVRARMDRAVDILAALHRFDPPSALVAGESALTPVEEVLRWSRSLETVDAEFRQRADELRDALLRRPPEPTPAVLCHGDFRLGNMLAEGSAIRAVIDWEIWTLADPRTDLAWLLMQVDRRSQPLASWTALGMPTEAEVVRRYAAASGAPVTRLAWFDAAARYKQAAVSALVVKHNRRRAVPDPAIERHAANPLPAIRQGIERLADDI